MNGKRVHLFISGLVQGVSYRWSAREAALRLGLAGWVRNLDSGEVEAVEEGPAPAVDAFIAWCHQGPPAAEVAGIRVEEAPATGEFSDFTLRRR
jgi:acylphosphatase